MRLTINNLKNIHDADFKLDGLTLIMGMKPSCDKIVCKSLYAVAKSSIIYDFLGSPVKGQDAANEAIKAEYDGEKNLAHKGDSMVSLQQEDEEGRATITFGRDGDFSFQTTGKQRITDVTFLEPDMFFSHFSKLCPHPEFTGFGFFNSHGQDFTGKLFAIDDLTFRDLTSKFLGLWQDMGGRLVRKEEDLFLEPLEKDSKPCVPFDDIPKYKRFLGMLQLLADSHVLAKDKVLIVSRPERWLDWGHLVLLGDILSRIATLGARIMVTTNSDSLLNAVRLFSMDDSHTSIYQAIETGGKQYGFKDITNLL